MNEGCSPGRLRPGLRAERAMRMSRVAPLREADQASAPRQSTTKEVGLEDLCENEIADK
jgi:hypothetical protein